MRKNASKVLSAMILSSLVAFVDRDAMATAMCNYGDSLPMSGPGSTNPSQDYCALSQPVYTGPGAALVTQDVSGSAIAGTYAVYASSLYNDAIYGYVETPGIGVLALAGTSTAPAEAAAVVASGSGAGVYGGYFTSAGADGVHGVSGASGSSGVAGVASASGVNGVYGSGSGTGAGVYGIAGSSGFSVYGNGATGTAVFGDNRGQSSGGHAAVNGQTADPSGYGGFFTNSSTSGTGNGYAVYAASSQTAGTAVFGTATGSGISYGVYGEGFYGVYGSSSTGVGGAFSSSLSGGYGVQGNSTNGGYGVFGECSGTGCQAGYFSGNVKITGCLDVTSTGGGVVGTCSSDARLKKNIHPLTNALERLTQLKGVTYEWIDPKKGHGGSGMQTGFIAQDVREAFPEWVGTDANGYLTVGLPPTGVIALEVEALKTLRAENDELKKRLKDANARSANIEERLDRLEDLRDLPRAGFGFKYGSWGVMALGGVVIGILMAGRKKGGEKA